MSAQVEPCGSEKVTPPAFFDAKSSAIMCCTKEMFPLGSLFCSYHAMPNACACSTVTTSLMPSPFDVVDAHLRAAGRSAAVLAAERLRVVLPHRRVGLARVLPPAVGVEDVDLAVAVDVAGADAMRDVGALIANLRREPRTGRVRRIGLRPSNRAAAHVHEVGLVRRRRCPSSPTLQRRVAAGGIDAAIGIPAPRLALWIDVKNRVRC